MSLDPLPTRVCFAAAFLSKRQGITPEACFTVHQEPPDDFGSRCVQLVHTPSEAIFVEFYQVGTRQSDPIELGRIERTSEGYVLASAQGRLTAKHFEALHFKAAPGGVELSVKGQTLFAIQTPAQVASELTPKLRETVRASLRQRATQQQDHPDLTLIRRAPAILVDGANIARMTTLWGRGGTGHGRIEPLEIAKKHLLKKGYFPLIIYDSTLRKDPSMDLRKLDEEVAPVPPHMRAPSAMEADDYILTTAATYEPADKLDKWYILSGDFFRSRTDKFPSVDLDRRLVEVDWVGATPTFTVSGPKGWTHKAKTTGPRREMLPTAGPPIA